MSLCWKCDKPFQITRKDRAKPVCQKCVRRKQEPEEAKDIDSFLKEFGVEI